MGPSICCLALHLLCPVGGLGRTPCWHVCPCHSARLPFQRACYEHFVWSQVGSLHRSSCCTSASAARLPVGLVLDGAHYQLHLLVVQVIFVTAGTSCGFTARRAADLEEGHDCMVLSRRHRALTAMSQIVKLWLGVGWALVAASSFCLAIANSCHCCE